MMRPIPLELIGPRARAILAQNVRGAVCSSHSTGLYCRFGEDDVILLHDTACGLIPFGLGCAVPPVNGWKEFPPGTVVSHDFKNALVWLGNKAYTYAGATTPPPLLPELPPERLTSRNLRAGIEAALSLLGDEGVAAAFMAHRDSLFSAKPRPAPFPDMWEEALWGPVGNLAAFCAGDDSRDPENLLTALLGLGPGLTPLGDDILCGLLAGGHALLPFFPGPATTRIVTRLSPEAARLARGTTTIQSAAFLRSASGGEIFGMLDAVLASLFTGIEIDMRTAFSQLRGVGHSTGSGLLLGILLAAELAVREI